MISTEIVKQTESSFYIECKPKKRTIKIEGIGRLFLQFPYVYFKLIPEYQDVYVAFNKSKVENPKLTNMSLPPLPNCYANMKVCMGVDYEIKKKNITNAKILAELTVDHFFLSAFESPRYWDIGYFETIKAPEFYKKWEKLTQKNRCIPLIPFKKTLK